MNEMQIFNNEEFGSVRVIEMNDEPWMVGKDVAQALGYGEGKSLANAVANHVDPEDKGVTELMTPGGKQKMVVINESGLYSLVLSSKLPGAKRFRKWVTGTVLPSIRKTGGYIAGQEELSDSELMARALLVAQRQIAEREKRIKAQSEQIGVMAPKAEYFDALVERNVLTNFRETAKELGVKERMFISFLIDKGYVYRDQKKKLMPYASKNDGLFELKEYINRANKMGGTQTLITPKGRETFRLLLQAEENRFVA